MVRRCSPERHEEKNRHPYSLLRFRLISLLDEEVSKPLRRAAWRHFGDICPIAEEGVCAKYLKSRGVKVTERLRSHNDRICDLFSKLLIFWSFFNQIT